MNDLPFNVSRPLLLSELSELFNGLPAFAGLRPFFENHRAAPRRRDQSRDLRVAVDVDRGHRGHRRDGRLTIKALRKRTTEIERTLGVLLRIRSAELCRCLPAPTITATYDRAS